MDSSGFSQARAFGLLLAYCLVYVLPLYASAATRASAARPRDAPEAIRARIHVVSLSTAACSLATLVILARSAPNDDYRFCLRLMGYWPVGFVETAKALFLTSLLFAAPLYECLVVDGAWLQWLQLEPLRCVWSHWPTWRNIIAGPVTEECLFRSAAVPLLLLAGSSLASIIFLSPLVFGLAHLHHFYEFRTTHPQTPLAIAIARSIIQLSYTFLFGAYATFIFLRTGSLLAAVSVHALCNSIGLPRLWGAVEPYWLSTSQPSRSRALVPWTGLYYILLVAGSMLWWSSLYSLTQSPTALAVGF